MKKELQSKRDYWQGHVNSWKTSGLSQKAYCKQENISSSTFSSWSKSLLVRSTESVRFVEIESCSSSIKTKIQDASPTLQLILANGVRIYLVSQANTDLIQQVLHFVGGL